MRNNSVKLFWIWTISLGNLELWQSLCPAEQNHLCNFGRGYHEKQFWNYFEFGPVVQMFTISHLELWQPLSLAEWNHLCNFDREYYGEHSCEIILNLDLWFRRCHLKQKFTDGRRTKTNHNSSPWTYDLGELKTHSSEIERTYRIRNSRIGFIESVHENLVD